VRPASREGIRVFPPLSDTIVAVSTGWSPSPLAIVRLSGGRAFDIGARMGCEHSARVRRRISYATLRVERGFALPAMVLSFRAPHSYTGDDLVELHVPGCLPALRSLAGRLIELGARRALPGEFTARAFLNGKLSSRQVDGIHGLIHAQDQASARAAARLAQGRLDSLIVQTRERLTDLLARVEAGIDFAEEEDVRFVTDDQVAAALDELLAQLGSEARGDERRSAVALDQPHVALVGRPNAGKSTLFNALLGYERALVSPVLGTTRDVLSAELELNGVRIMLQDCAGLEDSPDDLDCAARRGAEQAAGQADLILWVHDLAAPWSADEIAACRRLPADRRILVISKADRGGAPADAPLAFPARHVVSARTGQGLVELRAALAGSVQAAPPSGAEPDLRAAAAGLRRLRAALAASAPRQHPAELTALELRAALEPLRRLESAPLVEHVLGRIFAQFCIGK
jgi:tRNA modification GTPase